MSNSTSIKEYQYNGPLKKAIEAYIAEKRGIGLSYNSESKRLANFDRFTLTVDCKTNVLAKDVVLAWISKRDNECEANQNLRVILMRQFALFMLRYGYEAYVLPVGYFKKPPSSFVPYIFTDEELDRIYYQADHWKVVSQSPYAGVVIPVMFKILFCCGLRFSEIRMLKVSDVDLENGVLSIIETKFDKNRLVPMSDSITKLCYEYSKKMHSVSQDESIYFPNARGAAFSATALYDIFRRLLWKAGISHGGKGKGPRFHDIRHTFAVHCLRNWVQNDFNISSALPYLSAYLGHVGLKESQRYLRLTADLFPDINKVLEDKYPGIIPSIGGDFK